MKRREFITLLGGAVAWPLNYALASLGIAASWTTPIEAHDIYTALKDSAGISCCSERDCRPAHYRIAPAGVQMLVGGEWIVVPKETIQYRTLEGDTGETAGGHWCGITDFGIQTHCAILPPGFAWSTDKLKKIRNKSPPLSLRADEVIE